MLKKDLGELLADVPAIKKQIEAIKAMPKKADFGNAMTSVPNSLSALMRSVRNQPGTTQQNSLMKANMLKSTFNTGGEDKKKTFGNTHNFFLQNALQRLLAQKMTAKSADWSLNPYRWGMDSAGEASKAQATADRINQNRTAQGQPALANPNANDARNGGGVLDYGKEYFSTPGTLWNPQESVRDNFRGYASAGGELVGGIGAGMTGAVYGSAVPVAGTIALGIGGAYTGGKLGKTGAERVFDYFWQDPDKPQQSALGHLGENFIPSFGDAAYALGPLAGAAKPLLKPLGNAMKHPLQSLSNAAGGAKKMVGGFKQGWQGQKGIADTVAKELQTPAAPVSGITMHPQPDWAKSNTGNMIKDMNADKAFRNGETPRSAYSVADDFGKDPTRNNFGSKPLPYEEVKAINDAAQRIPGVVGPQQQVTSQYSRRYQPTATQFKNPEPGSNSAASFNRYTGDVLNRFGETSHWTRPNQLHIQGHEAAGHGTQSKYMRSTVDDVAGGYKKPGNMLNSLEYEHDAHKFGYEALEQLNKTNPEMISRQDLKYLRTPQGFDWKNGQHWKDAFNRKRWLKKEENWDTFTNGKAPMNESYLSSNVAEGANEEFFKKMGKPREGGTFLGRKAYELWSGTNKSGYKDPLSRFDNLRQAINYPQASGMHFSQAPGVQNAYNNPNSVANRWFDGFYKNFSQKTKDRLDLMGKDFVNNWTMSPTGVAIPATVAGAGQLGERMFPNVNESIYNGVGNYFDEQNKRYEDDMRKRFEAAWQQGDMGEKFRNAWQQRQNPNGVR